MMQMNAGILFFLLLVISESFILSEENVHGRYNRGFDTIFYVCLLRTHMA